jgi:hypothetical protein
MVKRTAPIRVVSLILLAACGALGQKRPSADLLQGLQFEGSNSPEVQRPEMGTWRSLPDAPSVIQPPRRAERFPTFVNETGSPLTLGAVGVSTGVIRGTILGHVTPGSQPRLTALYQQNLRYRPSTSSSFMGRATYAASRIFITRDGSGKGRLNTSYFLGVLTSVASDTAYRPSWARSTSATFNNFGSTIGSDVGMNAFHEFGPGIRQMLQDHTPKFVSRIETRITHDHTPREVVSSPAR